MAGDIISECWARSPRNPHYRIIADLEAPYRRIKREEKRLIGAKARYDPAWFAKRMAQLSAYSKKLRDGLMLARAVGDGFAWFFYERDPQLIGEHLRMTLSSRVQKCSSKSLSLVAAPVRTTTSLRLGTT